VFQGRTGSAALPNQSAALTWNGVPVDPPGSLTRTFRFTNLRVNATTLLPSTVTFATTNVTAFISEQGSQSMTLVNPSVNIGLSPEAW
jgi:hypothetical protein